MWGLRAQRICGNNGGHLVPTDQACEIGGVQEGDTESQQVGKYLGKQVVSTRLTAETQNVERALALFPGGASVHVGEQRRWGGEEDAHHSGHAKQSRLGERRGHCPAGVGGRESRAGKKVETFSPDDEKCQSTEFAAGCWGERRTAVEAPGKGGTGMEPTLGRGREVIYVC